MFVINLKSPRSLRRERVNFDTIGHACQISMCLFKIKPVCHTSDIDAFIQADVNPFIANRD